MGLARKLQIKPGHWVLVSGAPAAFDGALDLPEGAVAATKGRGPFDVALAFVEDLDEAKVQGRAMAAAAPGGIVWLAYRKGRAGLHRDTLHAGMGDAGLTGVSLVSIDETWSAMRFKGGAQASRGRGARA